MPLGCSYYVKDLPERVRKARVRHAGKDEVCWSGHLDTAQALHWKRVNERLHWFWSFDKAIVAVLNNENLCSECKRFLSFFLIYLITTTLEFTYDPVNGKRHRIRLTLYHFQQCFVNE